MSLVVADIEDGFRDLWPEAQVGHTVDDMIYFDYIAGKRVYTDDIRERVTSLVDQNARGRPDVMMFTGSVFGEPIEALRPRYDIPLLTAFDGIVEAAFKAGTKFGIITTSPWSLKDLTRDLTRYAEANGKDFTIKSEVREDARKVILVEKDREKHDLMLAESATRMEDVDALLLGQFSLSLAYHKIAKVPGRQVLTTTRTAIEKLKSVVGWAG
jgi:Asp/Glu/hydantoin racemase